MNIIHVENYEEMSAHAAQIILDKVKKQSSLTLGLATGTTPVGTYNQLIDDHERNGTSYRQIKTVNLDEYVGLSSENPNSYRHFMDQTFFNYIDLPSSNIYIPDGKADDLKEECLRYEEHIKTVGPVDLQLLGIGHNGHIGFNEPGTSFDSTTHVVELAESTRNANARFFDSIEEVPTKAITMGIATIIKSKEILLLASGESKKEALHHLIHEDVNEQFPASILKRHPNVTIIADEAAFPSSENRKEFLNDQ